MVGELGGLAPGRNWQGFFGAKGRWASGVRIYKTLSALGRWFGFGWNEIASSLIGSAGCKSPGLGWFLPHGSVWVITIQPFRTRMGPLNRISPADTWQARRRPWGCAALRRGACRIGSGCLPSAYPKRNRYSSFVTGAQAGEHNTNLSSYGVY